MGANAVISDGVEIGAHCVLPRRICRPRSSPPIRYWRKPAKGLRDRRDGAQNQQLRDIRSAACCFLRSCTLTSISSCLAISRGGIWITLVGKVIADVKPKLIVEVGTWKGASAIYMAKICRKLELNTEIVCIDTWLGTGSIGPGRAELAVASTFA